MHTDCIQVDGIDPEDKDDKIRLLFENANRSGGGEVSYIKRSDDKLSCLIIFADYTGLFYFIYLYPFALNNMLC